jgi:hypothetical protein
MEHAPLVIDVGGGRAKDTTPELIAEKSSRGRSQRHAPRRRLGAQAGHVDQRHVVAEQGESALPKGASQSRLARLTNTDQQRTATIERYECCMNRKYVGLRVLQ